jgi:aerobic carbon-monoxide dehydrogenase small subunit
MTAMRRVTVEINGERYEEAVPPRLLLSDFLRDRLDLTGTRLGCEHGVCGACTVLFDGRPARSCLMLAVQANGHSIMTIEGLADGTALHPVQQGFHEKHGLQCGFCTAGFVMSCAELLKRNPAPSDEEIYETLGGHLCRCTGYQNIVAAAKRAIELTREEVRS